MEFLHLAFEPLSQMQTVESGTKDNLLLIWIWGGMAMREECSDGLIFNYFRTDTNYSEVQRNLFWLLRCIKSLTTRMYFSIRL